MSLGHETMPMLQHGIIMCIVYIIGASFKVFSANVEARNEARWAMGRVPTCAHVDNFRRNLADPLT